MKIISVKSDRELWSNINLWEKIGSFQNITLRNQTNVLEGIYIVWMLYKIYVHLQKKKHKINVYAHKECRLHSEFRRIITKENPLE